MKLRDESRNEEISKESHFLYFQNFFLLFHFIHTYTNDDNNNLFLKRAEFI